MTAVRTPSELDNLADSYLCAQAELDPIGATSQGISGHDERLPELSPAWHDAVSALRRGTLSSLAATTPEATDKTDRVTAAAMRSELELAEEIHAAGHT